MHNILEISPEARLLDLRRQREQSLRTGYDGHNRRPIRTATRRLGQRRSGRRMQQFLHGLAREWSFADIPPTHAGPPDRSSSRIEPIYPHCGFARKPPPLDAAIV